MNNNQLLVGNLLINLCIFLNFNDEKSLDGRRCLFHSSVGNGRLLLN